MQAIEMGARSWAIRKAKLGEDHPNTLVSIGKLAGYYDGLRDSRRAAEIGERYWKVMKAKLGEDHPHTLVSISNLAGYYDGLGDSRRAAEMEERHRAMTRKRNAKLRMDTASRREQEPSPSSTSNVGAPHSEGKGSASRANQRHFQQGIGAAKPRTSLLARLHKLRI